MPLLTNLAGRAAVALSLLGMLACVHTPRTDAQKAADKEIEGLVEKALAGDSELYAKHIIVHSYLGKVELSGYVWEPPDLDEARRIAASVPGVTGVVNDLELQRNGLGDSPLSR